MELFNWTCEFCDDHQLWIKWNTSASISHVNAWFLFRGIFVYELFNSSPCCLQLMFALLFLSSDRTLCTNWYLLTKVCHSSKAIPGIRFKQQLVSGERNKPQTRNQTSRNCPYLAMDNCPLSCRCRGQYQWASYGNSQHI